MPKLWKYDYQQIQSMAVFPKSVLFPDGYQCAPGDMITINGTLEQEEDEVLNYFIYTITFHWDGFEFAGRVPQPNGASKYVTPTMIKFEEVHAVS